jgi:hypothetical protein
VVLCKLFEHVDGDAGLVVDLFQLVFDAGSGSAKIGSSM